MVLNLLFYIYVGAFVLFFFGFCIFIHELGHFLAAKWRKLHIVAFSIGFKKIWAFKHKGIEYRIGCLPFGGYVDLPQLEPGQNLKDELGNEVKLTPVKPLDRMIVAFAGPFFNILFGFFLGAFLWFFGIPQSTPVMDSITVASIEQESPEYSAGLREGDTITKINGTIFNESWEQIVQRIFFTIGKVELTIQKPDSSIKEIAYAPKINPKGNPALAKEGLPYPFFKPQIPIIVHIEHNSSAEKQGLKTGDRILEVNSKKIENLEDFSSAMIRRGSEPLTIRLKRGGEIMTLDKVKTAELPGDMKYRIGIAPEPNPDKLIIEMVEQGTPAFKAGLQNGDWIQKVNGTPVANTVEMIKILNDNKGKEVEITIQRNGKSLKFRVQPVLYTHFYLDGIGVSFYNHINPWQQFVNVINMSYKSLQGMFSKNSYIKPKHMSGPVGIVTVIGTMVYHGSLLQALNIIAIITFSLGLINLLPLPVLDGGHIIHSVIEMIIRRPISYRILQPVYMAFVFILITLMLLATFNDVNRITNFTKYIPGIGKKAEK